VTHDLEELMKRSFQQSADKGFHDEPRTVGDICMLITTEIAEAFEEYRNGHEPTEVYYSGDVAQTRLKPEGVGIELADAVIRIFDFCQSRMIPLGDLIVQKLDYNQTRSFRHDNKRL
jgi:NTP pyrophosphatase (non-canonical NTP hydrolase)